MGGARRPPRHLRAVRPGRPLQHPEPAARAGARAQGGLQPEVRPRRPAHRELLRAGVRPQPARARGPAPKHLAAGHPLPLPLRRGGHPPRRGLGLLAPRLRGLRGVPDHPVHLRRGRRGAGCDRRLGALQLLEDLGHQGHARAHPRAGRRRARGAGRGPARPRRGPGAARGVRLQPGAHRPPGAPAERRRPGAAQPERAALRGGRGRGPRHVPGLHQAADLAGGGAGGVHRGAGALPGCVGAAVGGGSVRGRGAGGRSPGGAGGLRGVCGLQPGHAGAGAAHLPQLHVRHLDRGDGAALGAAGGGGGPAGGGGRRPGPAADRPGADHGRVQGHRGGGPGGDRAPEGEGQPVEGGADGGGGWVPHTCHPAGHGGKNVGTCRGCRSPLPFCRSAVVAACFGISGSQTTLSSLHFSGGEASRKLTLSEYSRSQLYFLLSTKLSSINKTSNII
ncbi:unnamed protein product, partial [Heterosigma akashiwo]